ncbi:MAG: hypothetical protein PGN25_08690 [Methylorubrum populi]
MTTRDLYHSKPAQWAVYGPFFVGITPIPAVSPAAAMVRDWICGR